jgi:hypothetical protein
MAACRRPGCTSGSGRRARSARASGRRRRRLRSGAPAPSSKPKVTCTCRGYARAASASAAAGRARPGPAPPAARRPASRRGRFAQHQVDALLRREPADHREQHRLGIGGRPSAPAAPALLRALPCRSPASKRCGSSGSLAGFQISVSMPFRMPVQHARPRAQHAVQADAELRRLDLARIGRAHGGDRVGELQAGLEHRQLAPELDAVHAAPVVPGMPSRSALSIPNTPWKARLWMVMMLAAIGCAAPSRAPAPGTAAPGRRASRWHARRRPSSRAAASARCPVARRRG